MADLAGLAGPALDRAPTDRGGQGATFAPARIAALLRVTQATRALEADAAAAVGVLATLIGTGADVVWPALLAVAARSAVDEGATLVHRLPAVLAGAGELRLAGGGHGTDTPLTARMGFRANDAALAAVVRIKGEFDADINAPLLTLRTGAGLGSIRPLLFLPLTLTLALPLALALLLAASHDVFTMSLRSAATALCLIQHVPSGKSGQRRCSQALYQPAAGVICPGTRQCVEPMPIHRACLPMR